MLNCFSVVIIAYFLALGSHRVDATYFGHVGRATTQNYHVDSQTTAVRIKACGGSGGGNVDCNGKYGGCITAIVPVTPSTVLHVDVGGSGDSDGVPVGETTGGGSSNVRIGSTKVIVAAGGGDCASDDNEARSKGSNYCHGTYCGTITQNSQEGVLNGNGFVVISPTYYDNPTPSPVRNPTRTPTRSPTKHPTRLPTRSPTKHPTRSPTSLPTKQPTRFPTESPTTRSPTTHPTTATPTQLPTLIPTLTPTLNPTMSDPTSTPTSVPTYRPTVVPTTVPTASPTVVPTNSPTTSPTAPWAPSYGLVAYYPFSGHANDQSGAEVDGVVYGARLTSDRFETVDCAYDFDGTTDEYISIPTFSGMTDIDNNDAVTVSWWQKVRRWDESCCGGLFPVLSSGSYDAWSIASGPDSISMTLAYGAEVRCSITNDIGEWVHMAISFDDSTNTGKVYKNGVLECSVSVSGHMSDIDGEVLLLGKGGSGTLSESSGLWANGQIDEVRIYSRMLRDSEVSLLYTDQGYFDSYLEVRSEDGGSNSSGAAAVGLVIGFLVVSCICFALGAMFGYCGRCCKNETKSDDQQHHHEAMRGATAPQFEFASQQAHVIPPPPHHVATAGPPSYAMVSHMGHGGSGAMVNSYDFTDDAYHVKATQL